MKNIEKYENTKIIYSKKEKIIIIKNGKERKNKRYIIYIYNKYIYIIIVNK